MPKQSLAQKSVYWLKVISLGLILGLGIQFAKAWTPPTAAPPGGNVSGPLTNGITPQYKTGMLGVNSTTTPTNALEVGGGGNAYIGGSLFTAGGINATSGTVTGVLTSGKVQIVDVVIENTTCLSNGLVAKDSTGLLLSCQSGLWKKASGGGGSSSCPFANNTPLYDALGGTPTFPTMYYIRNGMIHGPVPSSSLSGATYFYGGMYVSCDNGKWILTGSYDPNLAGPGGAGEGGI